MGKSSNGSAVLDPRDAEEKRLAKAAVWSVTAKDGNGAEYLLQVLPRTDFGGKTGTQIGVRIRGPLVAMIIGLSDGEAAELEGALRSQRP